MPLEKTELVNSKFQALLEDNLFDALIGQQREQSEHEMEITWTAHNGNVPCPFTRRAG